MCHKSILCYFLPKIGKSFVCLSRSTYCTFSDITDYNPHFYMLNCVWTYSITPDKLSNTPYENMKAKFKSR